MELSHPDVAVARALGKILASAVGAEVLLDLESLSPRLGKMEEGIGRTWSLYSSEVSACKGQDSTCNLGYGVDLSCHYREAAHSYSNAYAAVYLKSDGRRDVNISSSKCR